ncbi:MAG: cytochrome P450 [Novosphingobium sp.]|nr:cytochrome P450 [Novosphingobium sp.]
MTEFSSKDAKACPVHFDHHTVDHTKQWPETYRKLREECPRAWTDNYDGFWVATRLSDIVGVAQQSDAFSAHKEVDFENGTSTGGVTIPPAGTTRGIPNEADNPEWEGIRRFINRRFAPRAIEERRAKAKQFTAALVDMVIETGECDFVDDLTSALPALVTMEIFGFPLDEWRKFADPFHTMVFTPIHDPAFAETVRGLDYFRERVDEEIAKRRIEPKDDFLTLLATGEINGEPLTWQQIRDLSFNILAGGVDTTTALASNALIWLGRNPGERQRLIDDPDLMPFACEEFIRFYSPIGALSRTAIKDTEVDGWTIRKGERVLMAYAGGNRDPEAFEDPEQVKIDRFPNKHVGFGAGMHRCLGSFLARMMFQEMIGEVLRRLPDYTIDEDGLRQYPSISGVNGWISIPAHFTPGAKVGAVIE